VNAGLVRQWHEEALEHVAGAATGDPADPSWRVTLHFHPDRLADGVPILDVQLPSTPEEFKAAVPGSIKKPFWVRCFVVAGPARLIDPPITSLKET